MIISKNSQVLITLQIIKPHFNTFFIIITKYLAVSLQNLCLYHFICSQIFSIMFNDIHFPPLQEHWPPHF